MTNTKIEEAIGTGIIAVIGAAILGPFAYIALLPFAISNAWALTILYGWFILPVFPTLPAIGLAPMLGVMLFKSALWHHPVSSKKDSEKLKWSTLGNLLHGPIALIFAYPIHWWMT